MTKASTDPVFAKIEAHRAAVTTWTAAGDISAKMEGDTPAFRAADRKTTKASGLEMKALRALLGCRPTTVAGVIALLDHLGQPQSLREKSYGTVLSGTECWWKEDKDELRAFPHMLADALRSLMGGSAGVSTAIDGAAKPR